MKQTLSLDQVGRDPGERSLSIVELASLPWPSDEQLDAFVKHVCDVHSWYKHLPLREGGTFYFFLASDAGNGYAADSPRLHHTWKTTEEYRRRFGFLDYSGPWGRDAGAKLTCASEIVEATRIVLYPYVCRSYNATDACLWVIHAQDVEHLVADGPKSPADEDALRWYSTQKLVESMPLSEKEFEQASAVQDSDIDLESLPKAAADYIRAERDAMSVYCELQAKEEAKIRAALSRLHALHERVKRG